MSSSRKFALGVVALLCVTATQAQSGPYPGLGRAATPKEIAAWDIDVRPDFKGLPKGSGSVDQGMEVWESKCSSCHGIFGESNEFFSPIVGGTTKEDVESGRVARLNDRSYPSRTTLMKVSTLSTLWDYIHRAMPWTAPKSLTPNEVFGVTAYILNMGGVVPNDFTLSDQNIAEVQKLMPNRNGMTTEHAMWPGSSFGNRKPDVQASACMKDCATEPTVSSFLPDFARNAHGNLAEQNRIVGAQHGADTSKPPPASLQASASQQAVVATSAAKPKPAASAADTGSTAAIALAQKHSCTACHGVEKKIIGPAFIDIAKKHAGREDVVNYLTTKIRAGGAGVWGAMPMPPQTLPEDDAKAIAQWLAKGASK